MLFGVKYDLDASCDSPSDCERKVFCWFLACLHHFASIEISCEFLSVIFDDEIKPCVFFVLHSKSLLFSHSFFFFYCACKQFLSPSLCIYCFVGLNHLLKSSGFPSGLCKRLVLSTVHSLHCLNLSCNDVWRSLQMYIYLSLRTVVDVLMQCPRSTASLVLWWCQRSFLSPNTPEDKLKAEIALLWKLSERIKCAEIFKMWIRVLLLYMEGFDFI